MHRKCTQTHFMFSSKLQKVYVVQFLNKSPLLGQFITILSCQQSSVQAMGLQLAIYSLWSMPQLFILIQNTSQAKDFENCCLQPFYFKKVTRWVTQVKKKPPRRHSASANEHIKNKQNAPSIARIPSCFILVHKLFLCVFSLCKLLKAHHEKESKSVTQNKNKRKLEGTHRAQTFITVI